LSKIAFFCAVLTLAALPLAAAAQDAAPTPAPAEHFVTIDGAVTGKTFNELAPGASTGGWGIRGVAEVPVIGHNWAAQIDYRQYNYQHTAPATMANGLTFACPAGNAGCVTPIGYKTYNAVFSPGPMNFVNSLAAQDSTTQFGFGSKIAPIERFYVSVGYVLKNSNYLGYPSQGGMGFGIDKLPDVDRTLSFYGNFWVYFNVGGAYTGPTSAALGTLSAAKFTLAYRLYAYRFGFTYAIPHSPVFVDVSDVGDRADVSSAGPSDSVHNAVFMGAGMKF
jgi:hypothetical protein